MKRMLLWKFLVLGVFAGVSTVVCADDRSDYNRRAAERDAALFSELDRNGDGMLTREEVQADLTLGPRFDDPDIDRDGVVTREEMRRYIERTYGVQLQLPVAAGPARR